MQCSWKDFTSWGRWYCFDDVQVAELLSTQFAQVVSDLALPSRKQTYVTTPASLPKVLYQYQQQTSILETKEFVRGDSFANAEDVQFLITDQDSRKTTILNSITQEHLKKALTSEVNKSKSDILNKSLATEVLLMNLKKQKLLSYKKDKQTTKTTTNL